MDDPDELVTLVRSTDAQYVDQIVSMLEAEGIPCQHPGRNHASMLAGISYIEIQLRVPRSRYEEAVRLVDVLRKPEESDKVAFRVRRTNGFVGTFIGFWVGVILALVFLALVFWLTEMRPGATAMPYTTQAAFAILAAAFVAGAVLGYRSKRDHCSTPSCGNHLPQGVETCPKCGAVLRGVIASGREHFAALEALD